MMPVYSYRARDEKGALVRGTLEAASADELTAKLRKMGYMATAVTVARPGIKFRALNEKFRPLRAQDLVVFNFQLANMIESGIPILSALRAIESQIENKKLKEIIGDVWRSVEAGGHFSSGLNNHPGVFSKLFINMVRAGEESGRLGEVLKRYAIFSEVQQELRERVKGALFYPAILFAASLLVILFIVTFIIPQFVDLFSKAGVRIPFITHLLFIVGLTIKRQWYLILPGLFFLLLWLKKYLISQKGRWQYDRFLLKVPVAGPLTRKLCVSRFARTLATLLSSGVAVLQSLDISKEVIGNEVIAEAIAKVRQAVEQGQKLSEPLKLSGEFPLDMIQMITAGEETGNLEGMLDKIADFYDLAVGYTIKKVTAIIEPLFLVIMGSVVAFIMASMLLPIFEMVKILRH